MDLDVQVIGERLMQLRELRGLSVSAVATKASVAKSYLGKIEQGKVDNPGLATLNSIAGALNVTLSELFAPPTGSHRRARWSQVVDPLEVERLKANLPESLEEFFKELEEKEGSRVPADVVRTLALLQVRGKRPRSARDWWFIYEAVLRSIG
jgi:transcriptional regulator with XRE-family HTH domain